MEGGRTAAAALMPCVGPGVWKDSGGSFPSEKKAGAPNLRGVCGSWLYESVDRRAAIEESQQISGKSVDESCLSHVHQGVQNGCN